MLVFRSGTISSPIMFGTNIWHPQEDELNVQMQIFSTLTLLPTSQLSLKLIFVLWSVSSSGSSQKVFPKFQKKVTTLTPTSTTSSTIKPEKPLPMNTLDNSRPLQWWLGKPLTPMKPVVVSILESYGEVCEQYFCHFKQKRHDAISEWPISDDHFVSIQGWVLEYTNTLWEKDMSEELLGLLENPSAIPAHPPSNLLFSGLNSMLPKETLHRHWPKSPCNVQSWQQPHLAWSFIDKLDRELPEAAQASYSKHAITKEVVAIEDTKAEMLATA
ncbi:hypothetical protein BS47DRAFT_1357201 [Hydnum rufescens UP504]|uniref:Uncharacterized protein n=1 Tax=Hydnum rufescens UP504 TaxID=1448309 RepID=A0A9P6BB22_9AGAM|nr:hypothetical protein BS47DRAFT_1357201 [Hydnum rufescens UP504]